MRILNVTSVFPPAWAYGGPVTVIYKVAAGLQQLGHTVMTLTTNLGCGGELTARPGEETLWKETPVVYYPVRRGVPFYSPKLRRGLRQRVSSCDLLLVNGNWTYVNWACRIEAAAANLPYILYTHGVFDPWAIAHHGLRKKIWWQMAERENYRRAAAIIAQTQAEIGQVRAMGVTTRIEVIPNGVDPHDFDDFESREALEQRFPALKDRRSVLFLGRLHRKKGLEELVPCFRDVLQKHPDVLLVLAGPDDRGYRQEVETLVRHNNLTSSVLFTGLVSGATKAGLLRAAGVFVLPSYSEGLPLGVLEAMACARPVVITPYCNLSEVAEAGAGLSVEPEPKALASAISRLLDDDKGRAEMGAIGLRLVQERFTWEKVARMTEALCLDILSKR